MAERNRITASKPRGDCPESGYLLEMLDMNKTFPGVVALKDARLQVRPGTVHALLGENGAGKSTLMKCLFGIYREDSGHILYNGEEVRFNNPRQALDDGISMVHQELNQVLECNVMENIWLGRFPMKGPFLDKKEMYKITERIFSEYKINVDPRQRVDNLSISQRQMVEIAKAVSYDARVIVLDEPTSSLTEQEVEHLFRIIRSLQERACGIIYISHKMEEIFQISDDVTIMRDGAWVHSGPTGELNMDKIISLMVGRDLTQRYPKKLNKPGGEVLMRVNSLTGTYQPSVKDVSFDLRKGEILGVAGLMGSRRTELVETLFGIRKRESGTVEIHGRPVNISHSIDAINNRMALLTEERRKTGIFAALSVRFNAVITHLGAYCNKLGFTNDKKMAEDTQWVIESMNVKTPSQKTLIENLSGGNQQKVILGRWLLNKPEILMLDEPTRGIDVGAKYEIYQLILELAKEGNAVIFISSEMPELLGVSDRIMVMSNGRMAGIVNTADTTQEELLRLSAKYL